MHNIYRKYLFKVRLGFANWKEFVANERAQGKLILTKA